ncbi:aldo/keto reductase [Brachybacterium kimchii]|uniref:Aldo/keto reductase n=1 Tax=Brachybacterium kimchii TaxID=2942909 RepID=A0ABY4N8M5_9MICO|nr:aldo/keto reductase [Brachybacterium kimchii]UQN30914.1 aldo/keto reductase [Brachybacterium kimchii]
MTILDETLTMNDGHEIPTLGLGTWMIDDDVVAQAVRDAVSLGYRHIDTAEGYGNERGVGEGVRTCDVPREELFVTTKLQADFKTYEEAKAAIQESLELLDIQYIDLMIVHSPQPWAQFHGEDRFFEGNLEAWRALEEARAAGQIRSIGVSNFEPRDMENILERGTVEPAVNQVLAHVGNTPFETLAFCREHGIVVEAYSPMGHGEILEHPAVVATAEKYGVSVPQLCIRYTLQLGAVSLPKTANPEHMRSNAEVDFEISAEDMEALKTVEQVTDYGESSEFPVYWQKD